MHAETAYRGNDALLVGLVLSVSTFWLFAQTANINAPLITESLEISESITGAGIAVAGVVCGMFIAVFGSIADRNGHVRMVLVGNLINLIGSLLLACAPAGDLAVWFFVCGRVLQGIAAALIMPATLTIVQRYWEGNERRRAISMWSFGSFGASGLAGFFGGILAQSPIGWRGVFFFGAVVSVIASLLVRRAPETDTPRSGVKGLDWAGAGTFALATALVFVLITQGSAFDWGGVVPWSIVVASALVVACFVVIEKAKGSEAFLDFALLANRQYSSVVAANFLANAVGGGLIAALWVLQLGYGLSVAKTGLLTLGFAAGIFICLRLGEKLLGSFGARTPMLIATSLVAVAVMLLTPTFLPLGAYMVTAVVGTFILGGGLAIFATPATDAALSALPASKLGVGSGFYKMASALGNGFGIAVSSVLFLVSRDGGWLVGSLDGLVEFSSGGDVAARQAGSVALFGSLALAVSALAVVGLLVPRKTISR
ncbi:MFS transporter [Corynebacterium liangguodongii]|uniref:MFS transporter n=1 Tax=Corynebacterium liangguodongii TaxID=2079535 RepID=A0A2S0WFP4_9CORY|nr:MFS transporter [Corynebacterium liangguodongii]AWB84598.1 MFS transporter [Corynebacterium liangguodongii]PWB98816.1 MFS transporter [Corynebacterium liangguodongii]